MEQHFSNTKHDSKLLNFGPWLMGKRVTLSSGTGCASCKITKRNLMKFISLYLTFKNNFLLLEYVLLCKNSISFLFLYHSLFKTDKVALNNRWNRVVGLKTVYFCSPLWDMHLVTNKTLKAVTRIARLAFIPQFRAWSAISLLLLML